MQIQHEARDNIQSRSAEESNSQFPIRQSHQVYLTGDQVSVQQGNYVELLGEGDLGEAF